MRYTPFLHEALQLSSTISMEQVKFANRSWLQVQSSDFDNLEITYMYGEQTCYGHNVIIKLK